MRSQTLRLLQRLQRSAGAAEALRGSFAAAGMGAAVCARPAAVASMLSRTEQLMPVSPALAMALGRTISSSAATQAQALTEVAVEGDADTLLREIDSVVSSDSASAQDVTDAAVALAYLQAKGNRRLWGKVFEKAAAVKSGFDAASLTSFLWAATTAGVGHFKTVFELAGPAAKLLPSMTPTQVSIVVEALGRAGAKDTDLLGKVADQAVAVLPSFKPADLARLLWGFAAAGFDDVKFAKAAGQALAAKASELTGREASQAVWALARLRRADKPVLDALVKSASGKLESGVDAAGLAWALGFIGYKADTSTIKALSASLKSSAGDLTPAHAIDAAWGLGVIGGADKATVDALFSVASSAISAAPDSLEPIQVAALFEAAAMTEAKLPENVSAFAAKMHALSEEGAKSKRSAGLQAFRSDLAEAVARANGARYRPEVAAAVSSFPTITADGVAVDIAVAFDGNTKVAVEAVGPHYLSSAGTPLGPALSRARLLEAQGLKPVLVPFPEFAAQADQKAKAKLVLSKIRAAVPAVSSKVDSLQKKLDEPFDAFAE